MLRGGDAASSGGQEEGRGGRVNAPSYNKEGSPVSPTEPKQGVVLGLLHYGETVSTPLALTTRTLASLSG